MRLNLKSAVIGLLLGVIVMLVTARDLEPIARSRPKLHDVNKVEPAGDDLIAKATLEEKCGEAEAIGHSESFSFDEAFKNALYALPEDTTPMYPDKMEAVRVVEIGARFGGFAGFNHLYVRIRREADPACLNSKKRQEAEPGTEEEIQMQQGEAKKLPGPEVKVGTITKPKPIEEE